MDELVFVIPGDPVPWTSTKRNQKSGNRFLPARQEEAIARGVSTIREQMQRDGVESFQADEPLMLSAEFYVRRLKGHFGTGRNARTVKTQFLGARPTGKPDFSNLLKMAEDCLVLAELIPDDDQIVALYAPLRKVWTESREEQPRSVIRIRRP